MAHGQRRPDPNLVLEQARARLQAMSRSLEKYVCVENVDRGYYQRVEREAPCGQTPSGRHALESTDRVRLEVTVSEGHELHSWPGATRFDTRDVDELIRNGPVSTGAFGGYLAGVFDHPGVSFEYSGEHAEGGKTLFDYRYHVPLEASSFQVKVGAGWRPAAYEGEFRIDPRSLELERLTVRTNELPAGAAFCGATTTLDYQPVHIGDSSVLLPRQSQLEIALESGRETRNVTTFSACREYQAESEIVFAESADAASTATRTTSRGRVALPIGLPVTLSLAGPIDTATAAAGDPVTAEVVKPVRRPGSTDILIPAGALVYGRIRRVEHYLLPTPYFRIALAFNRVDVQGVLSPFFAHKDADPEVARELGANRAMRDTGIWFWGVGTFLFPSKKDHTVIPTGFESTWFTLDTGGR